MNLNNMRMQDIQNAIAQMQQQQKPLVEFKAGICAFSIAERTVTPDKRTGKVVITQNQDGNIVIKWNLRPSGNEQWKRELFPKSATWEKVPECTTGRCFLLRFKQGLPQNKLQFFWMQEPKDDKDEEIFKKINEIIENPPSVASNPLAAGLGGAQQSGGSAGTDYNQAQLMSMLGAQAGRGMGQQAFGHQHHQQGGTFAPGNAGTGSSNNASVNNDRQMAAALAASLSSFLGPQMQTTARINLNDVLDAERVMNALEEDDIKRVLEFLPESQRDSYNLRASLRSPQLQQTVARLSSILNGAQFNAMMASMNLPHAGTLGVGAFLDAIQGEADKAKPEKKEDDKKADGDNAKNEKAKKEEKDQ